MIPLQKSPERKKTILICDDHKDIVYVTSAFLKRKYNVLAATSGRECISLYSEESRKGNFIDVILLDYKLGDMLGDEIAQRIKSENKAGTKIVLMTAFELDDTSGAKLHVEGLIDLDLKKPFSTSELERVIERALS